MKLIQFNNYTYLYFYTTIIKRIKFKEVHTLKTITIGTRNSKLSVIEARSIINILKRTGVEAEFTVKSITITDQQKPADALYPYSSGQGRINDIQLALQQKQIDMAVHRIPDLSLFEHEDFDLFAIPKRGDHREVYVGRTNIPLNQLPKGSIIGTDNVRSTALIHAYYPHLKTKAIHSSIHLGLEQLRQGKYAGMILDMTLLGLLDIRDAVTEYVDDKFISTAGQGALALECRQDDQEMVDLLRKVNDDASERSVLTERKFVRLLAGDYEVPIGAYAENEGDDINLCGIVLSLDGKEIIQVNATGTNPKAVAHKAADEAYKKGAEIIIERAKEAILLQDMHFV